MSKIKSSNLPLSKNFLFDVLDFCKEQEKKGRLIVYGGIPDELRSDYLDSSLPFPEKAVGHININPDVWRYFLTKCCANISEEALGKTDLRSVFATDIWRGGLAFVPGFHGLGIKNVNHFGLRRNEICPDKTDEIYLDVITKALKRKYEKYLVSDVMLATGGSFATYIRKLLGLGVKEDRIKIICVVAAPEGVYNLLKEFPETTIYACQLDRHLDKTAYICPGFGDAGDKFFFGIKLKYFEHYREYFNDHEWELLEEKILQANPVPV